MKISTIALAVCVLTPTAAMAQSADTTKPDPKTETVLSHMPKEIAACGHHDAAQEASDAALTQNAWDLLKKHDIAALNPMRPKLEAAAAHAPNTPSVPEKCGDKVLVYSDNMMDVILAGGVAQKAAGGNVTVEKHDALPYARLDFIIGWLYFNDGKLDTALGWYDLGLKNNPRDPMLASEYANTLSQLGRSADALAFSDRFLAENDDMQDGYKAMMLRRRGYALGELGRHDEAIVAYQDSLKFDPKSELAKNEIEWNQQQKAKGAK